MAGKREPLFLMLTSLWKQTPKILEPMTQTKSQLHYLIIAI